MRIRSIEAVDVKNIKHIAEFFLPSTHLKGTVLLLAIGYRSKATHSIMGINVALNVYS